MLTKHQFNYLEWLIHFKHKIYGMTTIQYDTTSYKMATSPRDTIDKYINKHRTRWRERTKLAPGNEIKEKKE